MTELFLLKGWADVYVIIGSAAGALIGLMFVVVTLLPESRTENPEDGLGAYATPTIVHLTSALLLSLVMAAPWPELWHIAIAVGIVGVLGAVYTVIALLRAKRQDTYQPVWQDWLWHTFVPFGTYAALLAGGTTLTSAPTMSLFVIAGGTAMLVFIAIHNAWDTVLYLALQRMSTLPKREPRNNATNSVKQS